MEELLPNVSKTNRGLLYPEIYNTLYRNIAEPGSFCIKYSHLSRWEGKEIAIRGHYNWFLYDIRIASYSNEKSVDVININAYVYPNNMSNYIKIYRKGWDVYIVFNGNSGQWYRGVVYCEGDYEIIKDISFIDDSYEEIQVQIFHN